MALAMVTIGETRTITGLCVKEEMKKHLQNLGCTVGEQVRVVGENPSGLILLLKGARIALNRGLATKISVA